MIQCRGRVIQRYAPRRAACSNQDRFAQNRAVCSTQARAVCSTQGRMQQHRDQCINAISHAQFRAGMQFRAVCSKQRRQLDGSCAQCRGLRAQFRAMCFVFVARRMYEVCQCVNKARTSQGSSIWRAQIEVVPRGRASPKGRRSEPLDDRASEGCTSFESVAQCAIMHTALPLRQRSGRHCSLVN